MRHQFLACCVHTCLQSCGAPTLGEGAGLYQHPGDDLPFACCALCLLYNEIEQDQHVLKAGLTQPNCPSKRIQILAQIRL